MADSYTLEVHSAVVRFDAAGKLFIHLTHSADDPAPVAVDGTVSKAPGGDKRDWLVGDGAGAASGSFPSVNELPRGLVIEVHAYDSATLRDDGVLEVVVSDPSRKPDWMTANATHVFRRDTEGLRMWSKSFLPNEDCTLGDGAAGKASVRTQGSRPTTLVEEKPAPATPAKAEAAPAPAAAEPAPAPAAAEPAAEPAAAEPAPSPKAADSEPYRPDRPPAGSYTAQRLDKEDAPKAKSGCLGMLLLLGSPAVLSVIVAASSM